MEYKKQFSYRPWETSSWDNDQNDLEKYEEDDLIDNDLLQLASTLKDTDKVGAAYYEQEKKETDTPSSTYAPKSYDSFVEVQKDHKGGKKPRVTFTINTSKCRSELDTIQHVISKQPSWGETRVGTHGSMMWFALNLKDADIDILKHHKLYFNRYPKSAELCRKRPLAIAMNRMHKLFPEYQDFIPPTFLYPEEQKDLKDYMKKHHGATYLVKTSHGCAGEGIILINDIKDIPEFLMSKDLIVQRYLTKPLLLKKKKFDLRVYVVYMKMNPITVYLCDQGLARFCTQDYEKPMRKNMKDYYKHLTNYSLNKMSDDYVMPDATSMLEINDSSKRTLESMWKSLEEEGIDTDTLKEKLIESICKTVIAMEPILMHEFRLAFYEKSSVKANRVFQIFGFDILFDDKMNAWLLEINANPSMNMNYEVDKSDGTKISILSPIDQYVKERVISDSIKAMKSKEEFPQQFNSLKRILPDQSYSQYYVFHEALALFQKLLGIKQGNILTASKFGKLSKVPGMTNDKLLKVDYDLIYKKSTLIQDTGVMNFDIFIQALFIITTKLHGNLNHESFLSTVRTGFNGL